MCVEAVRGDHTNILISESDNFKRSESGEKAKIKQELSISEQRPDTIVINLHGDGHLL